MISNVPWAYLDKAEGKMTFKSSVIRCPFETQAASNQPIDANSRNLTHLFPFLAILSLVSGWLIAKESSWVPRSL